MANVQYASSPEERRIQKMLFPVLKMVYEKSAKKQKLYPVPRLDIKEPDIKRYIPTGKQYRDVEAKIAPSLWQSYVSNVENPLINRFAGAGQLAPPLGGVSGAGMDALAAKREAAQKDISTNVYQAAQNPLLTAFGAKYQSALKEATTPYEYMQQMYQYPYQILPGILGGTLPQTVVSQPAPGGK